MSLASLLKSDVSDGIIAPGYEPEAYEILKAKKGGKRIRYRSSGAGRIEVFPLISGTIFLTMLRHVCTADFIRWSDALLFMGILA